MHRISVVYLSEVSKFLESFSSEFKFIHKGRSEKELGQVERRLMVKAFFSFAEAMTYITKQQAVLEGSNRLSNEEQQLARESAPYLNDRGECKFRTTKLDTAANFLFSFKVIGKAYSIECEIDKNSLQWHAFMRTLKVRHRIIHPKSASSLLISDQELKDVLAVIRWFVDCHQKLTMSIAATYTERFDDLLAQVSSLRFSLSNAVNEV